MKRIITLILVMGLTAMLATGCYDTNEAREANAKKKEQAFSQQEKAVPYPADQLTDSLERRNLKEKLLRDNKPEALRYVYLISFAQPLGYYTIKGKVTSTQSQMNQADELYRKCRDVSGGCTDWFNVEAPGDDGSYGPNESGIFFFTTNGVMVTTSLDYVVSDQPIPFDVPKLNK